MKDAKTRIAEAAFPIFLNRGYTATSLSQLLEATGLSKGGFYHHFKSKEEVYHYVLKKYFLAYFESVDWDEMSKLNWDALEPAMREFYAQFVNEVSQITGAAPGKYFILFFEAYHLWPEFRDTLRQYYRQIETMILTSMKRSGIKASHKDAVAQICQLEGYLFWKGIFPEEDIEI